MNTTHKTLLITGGAMIGALAVGAMSADSFGRGAMQGDDTVRVAIEANDYSQLSSEMQNKISEKKFAKMSQHKERKNAIKKALEANDYNLLPDTAKKRMSQEKFDQKVKHYNQKQAHKKAITQAVATNDFSAFEAAMETHRAEKEANRSSDDSKHHNEPEPTDEQKQEKFQKLVDYYNENGELPEHGPRMGGHKKGERHGNGHDDKGERHNDDEGEHDDEGEEHDDE